jgi:hypothetical protein
MRHLSVFPNAMMARSALESPDQPAVEQPISDVKLLFNLATMSPK